MIARVIPAEVRLGARTVSYTVRHSERARRMSLRVLPGRGLEVVLPRGSSLRDAEGLVRREQDWVLRALERFSGDGGDGLRGGASLPWLDERLTLSLEPGERVSVTRAGDIVTITTTDSQLAALALEAWYRAQARVVLRERALRHASTLRVEVRRVTIKDTRSRWGSCSERGNLNFSWRLMLAPRAVMDYVVAHEVAHLRELNHSPRFWAHVAALCPDYRAQRRWLRLRGAALAGWPATVIPDA